MIVGHLMHHETDRYMRNFSCRHTHSVAGTHTHFIRIRALPNLHHYCYFEYLRVDSTYSFFVPGGLNQLDLMFDIEFNHQQHMYVPT